jgi:hypothetical protein
MQSNAENQVDCPAKMEASPATQNVVSHQPTCRRGKLLDTMFPWLGKHATRLLALPKAESYHVCAQT